jgi:putative component of membrane protein insertase Oxa1/YidC/SpoIIIJ protein YidD
MFRGLICLILLTGGIESLSAQSLQDLQTLTQTVEARTYVRATFHHPKRFRWSVNPLSVAGRGLFHLYQRHLTRQLATACPYHPSCSEFSRQCFQQFNPFKAFALTTDRLTRCTRLHFAADRVNLQFTNQRWVDHPEFYRLP